MELVQLFWDVDDFLISSIVLIASVVGEVKICRKIGVGSPKLAVGWAMRKLSS